MHCVIYKSLKKYDTYLFVEKEGEFDRVPDTLMSLLGKLELVMPLELDENRHLAQADPKQVMAALQDQGYYLQLPPKSYIPDKSTT